jgi:hypothetical protein
MIKKFILGSVIALVATLGFVGVSHAAYMQEQTLQMGSTGSQVMMLQQTLNMTSCQVATTGAGSPGYETSTFASKTKAAVMCFQAANGLTADGVVGAMTGAKLAAVTGSMTVNTGMPTGCSSSTGYSTTTGAPCSGTPSTTVYPAGCVSTVGYSSTTGASCATGTMTTGVTSTGPLSINQIYAGSGYTNTNVGVGTSNKQVADLRVVTGAGGSGNLTGINLSFTNEGTGDFQFSKYASAVSIWYNGVQVGALPVSSFTEYNSQFSAYIPLSGAMLNPNTTSDLYISVTALPVIDSVNTVSGANNFYISGVSLRYSDSTGSTYQYSNISNEVTPTGPIAVSNALGSTNFNFNTAASADSIKLTVTKDTNDATSHTVQVSQSSNTQNVPLAVIDLNTQGSAVTVSRLPVTVEIAGSTAGAVNVGSIISTLRLYDSNGNQLDSESIPATATNVACSDTSFNPNTLGGPSLNGTTNSTCYTVLFQNFSGSQNGGVNGFVIPEGTTDVLTVKGDVNTLAGTAFTSGTYAVAEVTPTDMNMAQAYDSNNNLLPANVGSQSSLYLLGSTTGNRVYFYANGVNVASNGTPTATYSNPGGSQSHGIFSMTIPFSVTAYGQTAYVPSATSLDTAGTVNNPTATAGAYVQYAVDNGSVLESGATATITYTGNDNLTVSANGNYQVPVGQTKTFNLVITYTPTTSGSYRGQLVNVNTNLADATSGYTTYTAGLNTQSFRTQYVSGQ